MILQKKHFLILILVSSSLLLFCLNRYAEASTTVEDQNSSEIKQQERHTESNFTTSPLQKQQPESVKPGGLFRSTETQISIIDKLYQKIDFIKHRFTNLLTYGTPLGPRKANLSTDISLWQNESVRSPLQFFIIIGGLFLSAFCMEIIFRRSIARFIPEFIQEHSILWYQKISGLMARVTVDVVGLLIFLVSVITILFFIPKEARPHHMAIFTSLIAIIIVKFAAIFSRTVLAPNFPQLRILPITTDTARYIHQHILLIAIIGTFGWLISGIIGLFPDYQSVSFLSFLFISILVCCVIIKMCLEKRIDIRDMLQRALPNNRFMQEISGVWHHLAILYILCIWGACFLGLLLVGPKTVIPAAVTILAIPSFFLMDWLLQKLVDWWLHVSRNEPEPTNSNSIHFTEEVSQSTEPVSGPVGKLWVYSEGFIFSLRFLIRVVLAALLFFNIIGMWGIDLQVGIVLTDAAMNIIVATLVCAIIWRITNRAIEHKLKAEMPNQDEEMEEGGSGGSRIGTLLLLFQKFLLSMLLLVALFTVLSSLGINIGPLIAGAGVIGIAIGFGAQTLVRDIISGIFFLMDDAFRVGDFVDTGSGQGTVEHISLRSLRIRHPRGMVHTIPFGDIPSVTNFSRDYIITKLDFRVPFDTDIDKIRKIVKKIYNEILRDDELGPKLLGKMKSQGVRDLDDSALIMRIKFKSIPGEQFVLRREVFRRLQEAFHHSGLEFASRKVLVETSRDDRSRSSNIDVEQAAAAAITGDGQSEQQEKTYPSPIK